MTKIGHEWHVNLAPDPLNLSRHHLGIPLTPSYALEGQEAWPVEENSDLPHPKH